ncbi:MAG: RHS domain-containing protein [Deltaproteobacteria bacterium]|nr:RHS domain-containing protein [Deltaproteobacteria bacterium]
MLSKGVEATVLRRPARPRLASTPILYCAFVGGVAVHSLLLFSCGGNASSPSDASSVGTDADVARTDAGQGADVATLPHDAEIRDGAGQPADSGTSVNDSGTSASDAETEGDAAPDAAPIWEDESQPPPPVDPIAAGDISEATRFLYEGENAIQQGVAPGTIAADRVAVLRGRVVDLEGQPVDGVEITLVDHPEYGTSRTRRDGIFDIAVNGGAPLTVQYGREGYLPVQRATDTRWKGYTWLPEVALTPLDPVVTPVVLGLSQVQIARGSPTSDADGPRQGGLLILPNTTAEMILADGTSQPLASMALRITEYTVGPRGLSAMPGALPPESAYTYAVELSADEALAAGATEVRFSQPVPLYVENFLEFPVGIDVPLGYYDRRQARWIPSDDGRVIAILSIDADGRAVLDVDGSGVAADAAALVALGISEEERTALGSLYQSGQSLWRSPIPHMTPWDCNWPYVPPPDAEPPPPPEPPVPLEEGPVECGSIIDCLPRVLGEEIVIPDTPIVLSYRTDSVVAYARDRATKVTLSGPSIPASLKGIGVVLEFEGQRVEASVPATPNARFVHAWDGRDAYGRPLSTEGEVSIRTKFLYDAVYVQPGDFTRSFGRVFTGDEASTIGYRRERSAGVNSVGIERSWTEPLAVGRALRPSSELGLWQIGIHHFYDVRSKTLYLGQGGSRRAKAWGRVLETVLEAAPRNFGAIAFSADGSMFYSINEGFQTAIRRRDPGGVTHYITGLGQNSANGVPATEAPIPGTITDFSLGPDGSLYFANFWEDRVRRISPDGIIADFAGNGLDTGPLGDEGPALDARLSYPLSVVAGADGSVYVAEYTGYRVRRITPDGTITTVAGIGSAGLTRDHIPALRANIQPRSLAIGPDGMLYIGSDSVPSDGGSIHRLSPDGMLTTVAGTGTFPSTSVCATPLSGPCADGTPALEMPLRRIEAMAFSPAGELYFFQDYAIRKITAEGTVQTVVGNGQRSHDKNKSPDGSPATAIPVYLEQTLAFSPDGALHVSDVIRDSIRRLLVPPVPRLASGLLAVPDEAGDELYVFTADGRHQSTLDAETGSVIYAFRYDDREHLEEIEETGGRITRIERRDDGTPVAIVSPHGVRTDTTLDLDHQLSTVRLPSGGEYKMTYANELLKSFETPSGRRAAYDYNNLGELIKDEDNTGHGWSLERTIDTPSRQEVTMTSLTGGSKRHLRELLPSGSQRLTIVGPDGSQNVQQSARDGVVETVFPDGTRQTVTFAPDPVFGMSSPYPSNVERTDPATGQSQVVTTKRTAELDVLADLTSSLKKQTEVVTLGSENFTTVYDATTRTLSRTNDTTRLSMSTRFDERFRAVASTLEDLSTGSHRDLAFTFSGDSHAIATIDGPRTDVNDVYQFTRDGALRVSKLTDPSGGETVIAERDATGYPTRILAANGSDLRVVYAPDGSVAELNRNGRRTTFDRDPSSATTVVTMPGGGQWTFVRAGQDDQLTEVVSPDGERMLKTYRPETNTTETQLLDASGTVHGSRTVRFDRATSTVETVTGEIVIEGKMDGVLGRPSSLAHGTRARTFSHDHHGRLTRIVEASGGATLIQHAADGSMNITDARGLVSRWTRGDLGQTSRFEHPSLGATVFAYDSAGNMTQIQDGAGVLQTRGYDAMGRITRITLPDDDIRFGYDAPPYGHYRLTSIQNRSGQTQLTYNVHGEIVARRETIGGATLSLAYVHDADGHVVETTYPSGTVVLVERDATGRATSMGVRFPGDTSTTPIVSDIRYLPFGPMGGYLLPSGQAHVREYDAAYRAVHWMTQGIANWTFEYDPDGGLKRIDDNGTPYQAFTYDADLSLATENGPYGSLSYVFDAGGDLREVSGALAGGTRSFAYDAVSGRLTSVSDIAGEVEYDAGGRVTSLGEFTFSYDAAGHMTSALGPATTASYEFNGRGQRVSKTVNGERKLFVYGRLHEVIGEYREEDGTWDREILWLDDAPVAVLQNNRGSGPTVLWVTTDHLGTPRHLSDLSGAVVWSWQSDAFGRGAPDEDPDNDGISTSFHLRFPGQYHDPETGLNKNHLRTYSPALHRYLEPDPLAFVGTTQIYAYADGNPVQSVDPTGMVPLTVGGRQMVVGPPLPENIRTLYNFTKDVNTVETDKLKKIIDQCGLTDEAIAVMVHGDQDGLGLYDQHDPNKARQVMPEDIAKKIVDYGDGNLPVVFLVCHGGKCNVFDNRSQAQNVRDEIRSQGGSCPTVFAAPSVVNIKDPAIDNPDFSPAPETRNAESDAIPKIGPGGRPTDLESAFNLVEGAAEALQALGEFLANSGPNKLHPPGTDSPTQGTAPPVLPMAPPVVIFP